MKKGDKCIYLTNKYYPEKINAFFLFEGGHDMQPYHQALLTTNENLILTINSHEEAIEYLNNNPEKKEELIYVHYLRYVYPYSKKKEKNFDKKIKYYNDRRNYLNDDYYFYYEIGDKILLDTITLKEIKAEYRKKFRNLLYLKFKRFFLKPLFGIFFYDLMNLWKWYREFYVVEDSLNKLKNSLKNIDKEMWIHTKPRAEVSKDYETEIEKAKEELTKKESQILSANKNLVSLIFTMITIIIASFSFVINSWINENRRLELIESLKFEKNQVKVLNEENQNLKSEVESLSKKLENFKK